MSSALSLLQDFNLLLSLGLDGVLLRMRPPGYRAAILLHADSLQGPFTVNSVSLALASTHRSADTVRQAVTALCGAGKLRRLVRKTAGGRPENLYEKVSGPFWLQRTVGTLC